MVRKLTRETEPQLDALTSFDPGQVRDLLKARMDNGGMVIVHQEIYANALTEFADIVFPAAAWSEEDFARMQ